MKNKMKVGILVSGLSVVLIAGATVFASNYSPTNLTQPSPANEENLNPNLPPKTMDDLQQEGQKEGLGSEGWTGRQKELLDKAAKESAKNGKHSGSVKIDANTGEVVDISDEEAKKAVEQSGNGFSIGKNANGGMNVS